MTHGNGGRWAAGAWVTGFTLVGMAVLGYHPYAEDGGLYVAEIKHLIDPGLYPWGTEFVAGHLGPGVFTVAVAWAVRATGMRLDWVLLVLHGVCLWGMLMGVWLLAGRCYTGRRPQIGAVGLMAIWLGLPVGGTSLYIADPYLTARSVAMAMTLLGLAAVVRERWVWAGVALALGVAAHPLMGGYGLIEGVVLMLVMKRWWWGLGGVAAAIFMGGAVAQGMAPAETAEYARAAVTRYYWFLSQWHWFEWLGLMGPMAILGWVAIKGRGETERGVARMAVAVGVIGMVVAVAFVRVDAPVHMVARVQPLRCFQMVYVLMVAAIGAVLGERVLKGSVVRWVGVMGVLAGVMVWVARETYPGSNYLEVPGLAPRNAWVRAFVWVRENTPKGAVFAIDADYVHWAGEDAQGFRAIAERSVLPDAAKDGGVASIRPELVKDWARGEKAQTGLTRETDGERVAAVRGLGVSWVVLGTEGTTRFVCPYGNERVRVCRLPVGE